MSPVQDEGLNLVMPSTYSYFCWLLPLLAGAKALQICGSRWKQTHGASFPLELPIPTSRELPRAHDLQKCWRGPAAVEQEQGRCQKVRDSAETQMLVRGRRSQSKFFPG